METALCAALQGAHGNHWLSPGPLSSLVRLPLLGGDFPFPSLGVHSSAAQNLVNAERGNSTGMPGSVFSISFSPGPSVLESQLQACFPRTSRSRGLGAFYTVIQAVLMRKGSGTSCSRVSGRGAISVLGVPSSEVRNRRPHLLSRHQLLPSSAHAACPPLAKPARCTHYAHTAHSLFLS